MPDNPDIFVDDKPTAEELQTLSHTEANSIAERILGHIPAANDRIGVNAFYDQQDWVHPIKRQQMRRRLQLPNPHEIKLLRERVGRVMSLPGAPDPVETGAAKAREAVKAAEDALDAARHPDYSKQAVSREAKDNAVQAIAAATAAVVALEALATTYADEWLAGLGGNLADLQAKAHEALVAASRAYSEWAQARSATKALAEQQGRFASNFHEHPEGRDVDPLRLVGEVRKARDLAARTDDKFISGEAFAGEQEWTNEQGKAVLPPWTEAALRAAGERAPGGSWPKALVLRLDPADEYYRQSVATRDLSPLQNAPVGQPVDGVM